MIPHAKFGSWEFFLRLTLCWSLRNCIKLEVQTTIFSLGRMVSSTGNINWQCLFCILLAQLTATYDLYTILSRAKKLWAGVSMCMLPATSRDVSRNLEPGAISLIGGLEHECYFPRNIGNNHPNWLIFFRGVETTNQILSITFHELFQIWYFSQSFLVQNVSWIPMNSHVKGMAISAAFWLLVSHLKCSRLLSVRFVGSLGLFGSPERSVWLFSSIRWRSWSAPLFARMRCGTFQIDAQTSRSIDFADSYWYMIYSLPNMYAKWILSCEGPKHWFLSSPCKARLQPWRSLTFQFGKRSDRTLTFRRFHRFLLR